MNFSFQKMLHFSLFLAMLCANAAAEGGRWVFSSMPDGITGGRAASVVWGGGQFVAVGKYGAVSTSLDGHSWVVRSSGTDVDLLSVAWGEEAGYVVLGDSGRIALTSTDGVDWVKREISIPERVHVVLYAGGKYFASTRRELAPNFLYCSFDGVSWEVCGDGFRVNFNTIVYGNSVFMGISRNFYNTFGSIFSSSNGVAWNNVTSSFGKAYGEASCWLRGQPYPPSECIHTFDDGAMALLGVAYGNNLFLAGGLGDAFGRSEDGAAWEIPWANHWEGGRVVMPDGWEGNYDYSHIVYDGTRFVVARNNFALSADGTLIENNEVLFTTDGKKLEMVYNKFPKPLDVIASDGNASIVVISEDGQMGLLSKDTTSSVAPKPSSPKPAAGFSLRQSGKILRLTLPRNFRQGVRPDIALYSVSGRRQKVEPVFSANGSASLSVSNIPSGLYVLRVGVGKEVWQGQVVIKR